jgi:hypothetical protein
MEVEEWEAIWNKLEKLEKEVELLKKEIEKIKLDLWISEKK